MILEIDIDYDKFYSNKDIEIDKSITIKHPTIGEILDIGEENFYKYIEIFISRPYDHLVYLYELGYSFLDIDQYEFFINLFNGIQDDKNRYQWLIGNYNFVVAKINNNIVLYDEEKDFFIDEYLYYKIHKYVCTMLNIPDVKAKPANKQALAMLVKMRKRQLDKKNNNKRSTFSNYVGSLLACGFSYNEIHKMRIYNITETINRIKLRDNFNNVMYGMYSGNISSKDINLDDYEWVYLK